jgi:hypothetical protein
MATHRDDLAPPVVYLLMLAIFLPFWLGAGLIWGAFMVGSVGWGLATAVTGGLRWGLVMWVVVGNFLAIGVAWRRTGEITAPDRDAFRAAIARTCDKLRLAVRSESPDGIVLRPRRPLVLFRFQEVRVDFKGETAVLSAPAISFGAIRKELERALDPAVAGER